jgi:hypothetical protein
MCHTHYITLWVLKQRYVKYHSIIFLIFLSFWSRNSWKRDWKCKYIFSTGRHLMSLCYTPYILGCLSKDGNISWLISSQKIYCNQFSLSFDIHSFSKVIWKLLFLYSHFSYLLYSVTYLDKWPLCRTQL